MQAVQWVGKRRMELADLPKPEPKANEALVRVGSVGVCGSDVHYYRDGCIGAQVVTPPLLLGHEYAGVIEAVGSEVDPARIGQRVAVEPGIPCGICEWCRAGHYNVCGDMFFPGGPGCDGALCEYMCVQAEFCFPMPDSMSMMEGAMIEPVAVAVHTVELAKIQPGESVAIIGLGSIGLLTAQVAKAAGAKVIYGTDLLAYRVAAAVGLGVDTAFQVQARPPGAEDSETVAEIMDATGGRGVDVAFDCTNSSEGPALTMRVTRPTGRCVLTGISGVEIDPIPVSIARRRELNVQWCRRFKNNFPEAIELVASGKIDIHSLMTHSFPLEKTHDAFELVTENADGVLKASVDMFD